MAENGKLIVLEAVDDGVLTQLAERLCRWLCARGLAVEHTHEPTYGPAGTQILLAGQGRLQFDAYEPGTALSGRSAGSRAACGRDSRAGLLPADT